MFAYETMVWQCSVEDHMKSCFKGIFKMIQLDRFVTVHGEK